ncbi:hypothetical protein LC55x_1929 [Lysobacter capsici]|nr:hypothetical protein LC55x_1929 [Lysobacter capsici]
MATHRDPIENNLPDPSLRRTLPVGAAQAATAMRPFASSLIEG